MAEEPANSFKELPMEVNWHIACFIESDQDLCTFYLLCRSTHDALDGHNMSFWRARFLSRFDKPDWTECENAKYKEAYKKRRQALMYGARFDRALARHEPYDVKKATKVLEVLRDVIIDSFSEKRGDDCDLTYESKNMKVITQFIINHDLLELIFLPERRVTKSARCVPRQLLYTVQAVLAPAILSLDYQHIMSSNFSFPQSQQIVYGNGSIFGGVNNLDIDMEWVLHHINFWKYHMVREEEHTLYHAFEALGEADRPRFWSRQLKTGCSGPGKHWKGSYAFVDRETVSHIRRGRGLNDIIQDEFGGEGVGHGAFQELCLEITEDGHDMWPALFEEHLHSLTGSPPTSRAKTRAQHRSATPDTVAGFKPVNFHFMGDGYDSTEEFCAMGWLNALPPQQGIPGWQRMTMMKYFEVETTATMDLDALWAYEGVVLPGGEIILGRWWCANDGMGESMYSGPFILWCVDGPKYDNTVKEADDGAIV